MTRQPTQLISGLLIVLLLAGCSPNTAQENMPPDASAPAPIHENMGDALPLYTVSTPDSAVETAIIARYYGSCDLADAPLLSYDISMTYHKPHVPEDNEFELRLKFYEFDSDVLVQELIYTADKCIWPESIDQGLVVKDVNGDGNDDFLMELGVMGHMQHSTCFVYDSGMSRYVVVPGFDELNTPIYDDQSMAFLCDGITDVVDDDGYWVAKERYCVEGTMVVLSDRVLTKFLGEDKGNIYKVEQRSGDEMVVIQKDVPVEALDNEIWGLIL